MMKDIKRTAFHTLIGFELVLVAFFYLCGKGGLQALRHADQINSTLLEEVKGLEKEVTLLSKELNERRQNPFYKESIARKELQMAYKDETVYLLPEG